MSRKTDLKLRKFVAPEIIFGEHALTFAGHYAHKFGSRRVLLVTDPGVMKAGWADRVITSLRESRIPYEIYSSVTPNPKESEVMRGAELYRSAGCDCIVAVGGGSPLDCAKGIGIVCSNNDDILKFEGVDQISSPTPPMICVPTTGGTSADVSQFAIINDTGRRTKIAIISKAIVPDVALVDPSTLTTMDPYLTACTGLDALVHAIEAFVSNASSPLTDVHALKAVELVTKNLEATLADPDNVEKRSQVMLGSLEAGLAFSNASLGAVHAMAHSLGGFLDLPHGECNAMLLRHVVAYNFETEADRFKEIGKAMGLDVRGMVIKDVKRAILNAVDALRTRVGVTETLSPRGVKTDDIPDLASRAIADACIVTNPRKSTQRDLEVIYEEAL